MSERNKLRERCHQETHTVTNVYSVHNLSALVLGHGLVVLFRQSETDVISKPSINSALTKTEKSTFITIKAETIELMPGCRVKGEIESSWHI